MSYNIMCESSEKIDWKKLSSYASKMNFIEVLPMPNMGIDNGDAIGVCVPLSKTGESAWLEMEAFLTYLLEIPQLSIYELYSNKQITASNLHEIRNQII